MSDDIKRREILEEIYLRYRNLLYIQANRILHNHADAEDALQNTFLKLYRHAYELDTCCEARLKGYLLISVKNSAIDIYRKKEQCVVTSPDSLAETEMIPSKENHVLDCINSLPENYRNVIILKVIYGYSTEETARILNVSVVNVNKMYQRAKGKLETLCRNAGVL